MKKIIIPVLAGLLTLSSCEGFLEGKNVYNKDLNSFYSNPTEIDEAVAGMYLAMYNGAVTSDEYIGCNAIDDLMLGGGEAGGEHCFFVDQMIDPAVNTYGDAWKNAYNGIYRANALIENLTAEGTVAKLLTYFQSEEQVQDFLNQVLGEAYFMRGYFYLRQGRMFGGVPLITSAKGDRNVPRSTYTETFGQAGYDFIKSLEYFPNIPATAYDPADYGHANKWIAQAYLARTFMHYTGYMTNIEGTPTSTLPLPAVGEDAAGEVTKDQVVAALADCIANSGYGLLEDPRELWAYTHVNDAAVQFGDPEGDNRLPWARDAKEGGLHWAGQDGFTSTIGYGNNEAMFSLRFAFGNWGVDQQTRTNKMCLYFGLRDNSLCPFAQGWGSGTVHPGFIASWDDKDLRKEGSILRTLDESHRTEGFVEKPSKHYSGIINKKYQTLTIQGSDGEGGLFAYVYGVNPAWDMQLRHAQDFILLRFADVLLMHDELTETNTGMTQLRARAGLEEVPYSFSALKQERIHEFCFEATRWYDLVRWGDVYTGTDNYYGMAVDVTNNGVRETYTMTPKPEQKGLFPIPETEISIANGLYEENPGW